MRLLSLIWLPFRLILNIILIPVATIIYIFLAVCFALPSHLVRKLISFVAHLLDKDLAKVVTALATVAGREYRDWTTHPSQVVHVVLKVKGDLCLETLQQLVLTRGVHKCDKDDHLEYPELQQYCTTRLGHIFFKWDRTFDIVNHVTTYQSKEYLPDPDGEIVSEDRLIRILEHISIQPFPAKRSAWQVVFIPHFHPTAETSMKIEKMEDIPANERRSVFILRMHHCLTDGISLYRFLLCLTNHGLEMWESDRAQLKVPTCFGFWFNLNAFFCGPATFSYELLKGIDLRNPLHLPLSKLSGKYNMAKRTLPLKLIKNCRRAHLDISFRAVLIAGLTGGIRNFMIKNNMKLPNSLRPIRLGMPVPKPGHTTKLRNEYLSAGIDLPVHKKTPRKRLFKVEELLLKIHRDGMMPVVTQAQTLMGGFPYECVRFLTRKTAITVMYSEIKGPTIPLQFGDGECSLDDLYFTFGLCSDDLGMAFAIISYHDRINFVLSVDRAILTKAKVDELIDCIEKEIVELQYGDSTNL